MTLNTPAGAGCPEDSKLGTVEVQTPLLFTTVYGSLYLAQPYDNPFKTLIALYVIARSRAERGIIVKLAGRVVPDPATGRFSPLYVTLARTDAMAEIGSYSTVLPLGLTADLTGVPQCPLADVEQARQKTGIGEEQAPSCPRASLIGHSLVGTGVGAILDYVPGALYLSGPFRGDPLSVVSITSAVVGPFDLGTVVIRFGLHIDPYTAQVSIDPSGSEPIPRIIDGIVTHVREIRVSIDRPDFTINPTGCQPRPIASTLTSTLGQTASTSTGMQAENCDELAFKPKFTASTNGKTSRAKGASLKVKLTMPIKLGTQANIRTVKVELPKQLPSRLETLQHACPDSVFNANPAACPKASLVGRARATTPILPEPLTGPAIFVSHGGEAFPDLVLVLQGYGFTIDLVGSTYINRAGITSTTFKTVPDEPVGSFELTMPQGPYSALAANADLCKLTRTVLVKKKVTVKVKGRKKTVTRKVKRTLPAALAMPTAFTAQNGRVIKQSTKIGVTGCPKKKAKKASRSPRRGKNK